MLQVLHNAALILLNFVFDIYLIIIILRILLPWVGADYYNPISQLVNNLTKPVTRPIQKIMPHTWPHYSSAIVLLLIVELLQTLILTNVTGITIIFVMAADITNKLVTILLAAIIVRVVWSWINPNAYHPIREILHLLTDPILLPIRAKIKPIAGIDVSPLIALFLLQLVLKLLVDPILY